ncbi:MAG: hypothetical protein J3K34DRAFT_416704 [Monoraphidium minutum]|nr:MAG: hypothetical protein J3K34DRAFT_416704 [Monoraphidium minutum]
MPLVGRWCSGAKCITPTLASLPHHQLMAHPHTCFCPLLLLARPGRRSADYKDRCDPLFGASCPGNASCVSGCEPPALVRGLGRPQKRVRFATTNTTSGSAAGARARKKAAGAVSKTPQGFAGRRPRRGLRLMQVSGFRSRAAPVKGREGRRCGGHGARGWRAAARRAHAGAAGAGGGRAVGAHSGYCRRRGSEKALSNRARPGSLSQGGRCWRPATLNMQNPTCTARLKRQALPRRALAGRARRAGVRAQ